MEFGFDWRYIIHSTPKIRDQNHHFYLIGFYTVIRLPDRGIIAGRMKYLYALRSNG
jgi:hypothetical protein